jgi:hypothetical protein
MSRRRADTEPPAPPDGRQPHVDHPQPTDAFEGTPEADFASSRDDGSPPPPARPATPVTTRPRLVPDDGTNATPPGPEAVDGPMSPGGARPIRRPRPEKD